LISVGGNVGSVTVGAFNATNLFAGYSAPTDGTGTFSGAFSIGPITVKASANGFVNSNVIATSIKNVTLASAVTANSGTKFGFVFQGSANGTFCGLTVKNPVHSYNRTLGGTQDLDADLWVVRV
jgi:hypothetical protein